MSTHDVTFGQNKHARLTEQKKTFKYGAKVNNKQQMRPTHFRVYISANPN